MEETNPTPIEEEKDSEPGETTWDSNKIMGVAAIFISILSMFAVIYQSYLAREDNDLTRIQQSASVLPYLTYWYSNVEGEFKFVLANKGVGPAFVKEVHFFGNDEECQDSVAFSESDDLFAFMSLKSGLIDSTNRVKSSFGPNDLLSPSEVKELIAYKYRDKQHAARLAEKFHALLLRFQIVYEDVYGSAWKLDSERGYPEKLVVE